MITRKQELQMDISNYKSKLRKVRKDSPGDVLEEIYSRRIQGLEAQLATLSGKTLKASVLTQESEPKKFYYDPQGHYYEVWINGELFLECSACSADGPGNCGCWSN